MGLGVPVVHFDVRFLPNEVGGEFVVAWMEKAEGSRIVFAHVMPFRDPEPAIYQLGARSVGEHSISKRLPCERVCGKGRSIQRRNDYGAHTSFWTQDWESRHRSRTIVVQWLVKHCAEILNQAVTGPDGKTTWDRASEKVGAKYSSLLPE